MTNKIKILIGDDSAQYGVSCASSLRSMGFFVITRPKDGLTIFEAIKNFCAHKSSKSIKSF